jgi:hypothetical protein
MEASRLLDEEEVLGQQPASIVKRRGVIAVALGCVGAVCLAGQSMKQTSNSLTTSLLSARDKVLTVLQDETMFEGDFAEYFGSFTFAPVDAMKGDKFSDGMSIDFDLTQDETVKTDAESPPDLVVHFKAKDGKEEALSDALKAVYDEVKIATKMPEEVPFKVEFIPEDGGATIRVVPTDGAPLPPLPPTLPKLSFNAGAKFGRSFEEMFDRKDLQDFIVVGGFKAYVKASLPQALLPMLAGPYPYAGLLSQFVSEHFEETVLYKSEEDMAEAAKGMAIPSLGELMDEYSVENLFEGMPDLQKAIKALPEYADGLDGIEVGNLPSGWVLRTSFNNFHITPVLAQLV